MAFTDQEKVDIRRFCGFPAYANYGWVYVQSYGILETRIANMSDAEETVVRTVYLANLTALETDVVGTRENLDTAVAAVWTHNRLEQADRENLLDSWRRRLCGFIGVPPGPALKSGCGVIRT